MPTPATTNQPWWSYDVGLIHMVGMSSEHDYSVGSDQYNWLLNDLKSVDRTVTPWVIFGSHRAMYLNSDYGGSVTSDLVVMDNLIHIIEPLLWKYRVNLGFYGHNHVVCLTQPYPCRSEVLFLLLTSPVLLSVPAGPAARRGEELHHCAARHAYV